MHQYVFLEILAPYNFLNKYIKNEETFFHSGRSVIADRVFSSEKSPI